MYKIDPPNIYKIHGTLVNAREIKIIMFKERV